MARPFSFLGGGFTKLCVNRLNVFSNCTLIHKLA